MTYQIQKHGRHWKVLDPQGELVVVAVYKKGALAVKERLERYTIPLEDDSQKEKTDGKQ